MAAGAAVAGVPTAGNSTLGDPLIILRAYNGSPGAAAVDQAIPKTIIVRDAANNPVPNSVVVLDFSACTPDIKIGSTQVAGTFVNCAAKTVSGVTDVGGSVTFRVVGASNTTAGTDPGSAAGCCSVVADGVVLGPLSVATPDLNGARGGGSDPGMDGADTAQYTQSRFPNAVTVPCTSTNPNFKNRANLISVTPCAFQIIAGDDTAAFTLFRFGVGRNPTGGGTGTNGPFCP
jgi:hypothetical protein